MKVHELIAVLQEHDPDLHVIYPDLRGIGYSLVSSVITTTEDSFGGKVAKCVVLNPTFKHIERAEALGLLDPNEQARQERAITPKTKRSP